MKTENESARKIPRNKERNLNKGKFIKICILILIMLF